MTQPTRAAHPLLRRMTLRTRLTLSYAGLITGSGAILITLVYLYMRFVPSYRIFGGGDGESSEVVETPEVGATQPAESVSIASADDFLDNLLLASILALVLMALVGAGVGWLVARRIVRPLGEIGAVARRASAGSLDHRVGLSGPPDEIQDLADTFDSMLDSLERSFAAQRRFTANASHELQTPLATTKTMIDVVLADPSTDADALRTAVARIREVNQGNIETVEAMLDLATAEHGGAVPERVDLRAVTRTVTSDLRADAERRSVEIEVVPGEAVAWASPVLVRGAVSNVVRNAIAHNHTGGHVRVSVGAGASGVRLTVVNTGAVVDPAEAHTLTEPFVRGAGRSITRGSGHGLGLAIAHAAISANGGALTLEPNGDGGLTVTIDLPAAEAHDQI